MVKLLLCVAVIFMALAVFGSEANHLSKYSIAILKRILKLFCFAAERALACRDNTISMNCAPRNIRVVSAMYGRTDTDTCGGGSDVHCRSSTALNELKNM